MLFTEKIPRLVEEDNPALGREECRAWSPKIPRLVAEDNHARSEEMICPGETGTSTKGEKNSGVSRGSSWVAITHGTRR